MRKNRMMRLASVLLILTLLTTSVISGTFAKYTSTASGSDTARVAKWSFKVGGTDIATTNTITFNLFSTINEEDTTTDETDVKDGKIIAPGTGGSFGVVLTNASEVNATYAVACTADEKTVPLQWSVDGVNWVNDIAALDISATAINMGATANVSLYWKWAFNDETVTGKNDTIDTELGKVGTAEPTVTLTITATQVD